MNDWLLPLLLLCGSLLPTTSPAQADDLRWGRIDPADLSQTHYAPDSSVAAWVLADNLSTTYFMTRGELKLRTVRHRRVKLFQRSAFSEADLEIAFHRPTQTIDGLRACLYLPDGEVLDFKRRDFALVEESESWLQYQLSLPRVTEGAILEYRYEIVDSDILSLPSWVFQEDYPVRYSEYRADVPEWFDFVNLSLPGLDLTPTVTDTETDYETFTLPGTRNAVSALVNKLRVVYEDVPPIQYQPYTNNLQDYLPQVRFQLRAINWPDRSRETVLSSWAQLAAKLEAADAFGEQYLRRKNHQDLLAELQPILSRGQSAAERARLAYYAIAARMNWDEQYGIFATDDLDAAWEEGESNSGTPNLMLLAVLRSLDIEAYPVLVGTRDNGLPIEYYPILNQFDHVMVVAKLDTTFTFLDIGSLHRPAGLPRIAALNHRGWVAAAGQQQWIDIAVPVGSQSVLADLQLGTDGIARGRVQARLEGYYAAIGRDQLQRSEALAEGPIVSKVLARRPDAQCTDRIAEALTRPEEPLKIEFACAVPLGERIDDFIYLDPVLLPSLTQELVATDNRRYPIDMPFPWQEQYILTLRLPEGYAVEELPASRRVVSQDRTLSFYYRTSQREDQLKVIIKTKFARTFYPAEEYAGLRQFFAEAIDRQGAQIVLRKITK